MGNTTVPTELVSDSFGTRLIALVPSSTGKTIYRVDVSHGMCDCPAWIFQRGPLPQRKPCKHLLALGYTSAPKDDAQCTVTAPQLIAPKPQAAPINHYDAF